MWVVWSFSYSVFPPDRKLLANSQFGASSDRVFSIGFNVDIKLVF